jgi:hypothetical protein
LLIAAAMLLLPASLLANTPELVRITPAHAHRGGPPRPAADRSPAPRLAQTTAAPAALAGTYAGEVERHYIGRASQATRTYRLTMNPDMNTGKVLIYDPDGGLRNEIGLVGKITEAGTFEGTTTVINASPNYKPDKVRLVFSSDGASVQWYHNDGTIEGAGTLWPNSRNVATADEVIAMIRISAGNAVRILTAAIASPALVLIASGASAQEIRLTRPVQSGAEAILVDERAWNAKCKPLGASITITSQPINGKVTIVPGVSVVPISTQSGSAGRCGGKSVSGNQILYKSNAGFRGIDTLAYEVRYPNGKSASTTITINVK